MSGRMPISDAFDAAVRHHQVGQLDEAELIYRQILSAQPGSAQVLYLLGRIEHDRGRIEPAIALFQQAIAADARDPIFHRNLGEALATQGRLEAAKEALREAVRLQPDYALAHNSLGRAWMAGGETTAAELCFREALNLKPDFFEALNNLGMLLSQRGNLTEARTFLTEAVRVRPDAPSAHANLGNAFGRAGLLVEAIESFRQALQLNPNDPALHFHLGVSLQQIGRYREALDAMREVARLDPNQAAAFVVAGYLCNQLGDPDQALLNCKKAIELDANLADTHCNLGLVYQSLGLLDEAIESFRRGEEIDPAAAPLRVNLLYALNFHPGHSPEEVFAEHRVWAARHADPLTPRNATFDNDRAADRRLRIGYVSAHFRGHAVNSFVEPILTAHDPASCEVYCYSNLVPARGDETTNRLRGHADHWREIAHLNDEQASQMVRTDRIDILVDLAGHIEGSRLPMFARKPAPIQVTYIGYQNTTGMSAMDYRLTDEWSDPQGMTEAFYTEHLVRLPHAFFCYLPPEDAPATTRLPALAGGHVTFGSFNNFAKVTPQVLKSWARLLAAVPQSRLILLVPRSQSVAQRVQEVFTHNGVEPRRVELVPRQPYRDYLRLIAQADIALDAFPFNGHTTTCDSLWTGVPVVMLAGNSYASRFGGSALVNLGLSDLIARSPEQYVDIAAGLAADTERLSQLRAELRTRMANSALLDGPGFTRGLEAAYRQMWHDWCSRGGA